VKIRGFRIELSEVESQLRQLATVREAVVLPVAIGAENGAADKRIVAYVETAAVTTSQAQLADELKLRLPSYMLPSAWVLMPTWPLTPNGKIDRQRLPAPNFNASKNSYVAPRSALEADLAAIWQTVLGLDRVGIESSFFDLGGHSLSAMQIVTRIQQQLGLVIPLRTLFDKTTIAELAAALDAAQTVAARPAIEKAARDADLPLSFGQQRVWLMQQLNPTSGFFNMPAALWLEGVLDHKALQAAFDEMTQRHESLRTTFPLVGGQPVQRIMAPTGLPITSYTRQDLNGEMDANAGLNADVDEAVLIEWVAAESAQPFDLQQGPLVRVGVLPVAPERHLLLINMHHIIGDDWSRRLFLQEF
ncbi:MAG: non-ribosomal peptide synthetase, partial [Caldilineaceae bacterium]|nr:non-ribosomal peptide synthetase [Caldilineaceae bacterium]